VSVTRVCGVAIALAFALGQGAQLLKPLAIAVIGGFVASGPLVLVVLPALYARLDPNARLAGAGPAAGQLAREGRPEENRHGRG
jgi:Cu/Ag efflux pump CusA